MGIFRDGYGWTGWGMLLMGILVCSLLAVSVFGLVALINISYEEGVEKTITGTIQLHQLCYDKFWNLEYTNCEMLTYSGDTHHIELKNHIEFECGKTYRITFKTVDYWGHIKLVNEVVSITRLS